MVPRRRADDTLDPALWQNPQMRAALGDRDIAVVYRRMQSAGVSQRRIAALTGQSQSEISEILGGRRVVNYDVLVRIADGLGVPRGWMGLASTEPQAVEPTAGTADPEQRPETLPKEPLESRSSPTLRSGPFLPAMTAGLGAAMLSARVPGTDVAPRSVAVLTATVRNAWQLRQRTRYESLGQLLLDLVPAVDAAASVDSPEREQAIRIGAHTYNLASALLKRLGDYPYALVAADRALAAARDLDDGLLIAATAFRLANVLLPAGRPEAARQVALDAVSVLDQSHRATPRGLAVWGGLLLTAALAAARELDDVGAWEILGEARAVARMLGTDHADIFAVFGPTNVAIHGVQIAVEVGDGVGATKRGQRIDVAGLPDSLVERRAQLLIDMSRGHTLQNDYRSALVALLQAERQAPQEVRMSTEVHHTVNLLLDRTHGATPELRKLAQRVGVIADPP